MLKKKINFIVYIFILSAFFITFGCEKSDNNLVNNKLPQPGNNSEINQDCEGVLPCCRHHLPIYFHPPL